MIKLEHVVLASPEQMEFIIEGMRNPMNSWEKSDSEYETSGYDIVGFDLGENDHSLMQRLTNAGTDHRKFMRMMPVYVRITAPLYWWKEFDTYKVGTVANSCSTMHKIAAKEFTLDDFSCEHLNRIGTSSLWDIIDILNVARKLYLNGGEYKGENYDSMLRRDLIKNKIYGMVFIVLGALTIPIEWDATFFLFTLMLGILLFVSGENCIMN